LLAKSGRNLAQFDGKDILLKNELPLYHVLGRLVFEVAVAPAQEAPAHAAGVVSARSPAAS